MKKMLFMLSIATVTASALAVNYNSNRNNQMNNKKMNQSVDQSVVPMDPALSRAQVSNESAFDIDNVRVEVEVLGNGKKVNGSVNTGPLAAGESRTIDLLSATRKEYGARSVLDMFDSVDAIEAIEVTQIQPQNCTKNKKSEPCLGSILKYGNKGILKKDDKNKRLFVIMDVENEKAHMRKRGKSAVARGILVEVHAQ